MSTQSAETLKALLCLSKVNMDVPLSEAYAVMQNSLLIDLMGCSGCSLNLKRDSFNLQDDDPDEIPDDNEDILQDDTELEDEEDDD